MICTYHSADVYRTPSDRCFVCGQFVRQFLKMTPPRIEISVSKTRSPGALDVCLCLRDYGAWDDGSVDYYVTVEGQEIRVYNATLEYFIERGPGHYWVTIRPA